MYTILTIVQWMRCIKQYGTGCVRCTYQYGGCAVLSSRVGAVLSSRVGVPY